ncbi:hypothetical protein GcM3_124022, partial [Golovinomyces cichoracearum]
MAVLSCREQFLPSFIDLKLRHSSTLKLIVFPNFSVTESEQELQRQIYQLSCIKFTNDRQRGTTRTTRQDHVTIEDSRISWKRREAPSCRPSKLLEEPPNWLGNTVEPGIEDSRDRRAGIKGVLRPSLKHQSSSIQAISRKPKNSQSNPPSKPKSEPKSEPNQNQNQNHTQHHLTFTPNSLLHTFTLHTSHIHTITPSQSPPAYICRHCPITSTHTQPPRTSEHLSTMALFPRSFITHDQSAVPPILRLLDEFDQYSRSNDRSERSPT